MDDVLVAVGAVVPAGGLLVGIEFQAFAAQNPFPQNSQNAPFKVKEFHISGDK